VERSRAEVQRLDASTDAAMPCQQPSMSGFRARLSQTCAYLRLTFKPTGPERHMTSQAEQFAALHAGPEILVLPNAWDAASAAVMEDAGAKAVATSSAAVAWAHGYPDGDLLPLPNLLSTISAVARVVKVPVTADIEGGYTDDLGKLADNIKAVIGAGAVGINLEDGPRDPDLHARKIEATRKAADAAGVALFINARIDTYLKRLFEGDAAEAEAETVKRAALYRRAGADGIFTPGPTDEALIGRLAAAIDGPMNIMLTGGLPSAARLQELGVRRLSSGGRPFAGAYAYLANAVKAYLADGLATPFLLDGLGNLNKRFET
jgi:2-methylisocitrate lyase-like PEP mutase family enzyme